MENAFAHATMSVRVPGILRTVQAVNPDYPPAIMREIDRLHDALTRDEPIRMLELLAPDYQGWEGAYQAQLARHAPLTWLNADWFFAETFCYRHLVQAVRWFETGRDPFISIKQAELESERIWQLLDAALEVEADFSEKLALLLSFVLWGNRVDLSHPAGELAAEMAEEDELLVDDRHALVEYLASHDARPQEQVHIIVDNAGPELAMDLTLADFLIEAGHRVVMHVKSHPTFVSDAIITDVWSMLQILEPRGGKPALLAGRLRLAWSEERLRLAAHPFWTSSRFLWDMPSALRDSFAQARFVILKGDANYRRATGDAIWDPAIPFSTVMDYFPAPLVVLRSIKSDVLAGVPVERTQRLDATNTPWRPTGRYGVIQFAVRGE
jgi:hypothetical protein